MLISPFARIAHPQRQGDPASVLRQAQRRVEASLDRPPKLLLWHWGRIGAAAKFSFELARALDAQGVALSLSCSAGSDLDRLRSELPNVAFDSVVTFHGSKETRLGRFAALLGLLRLPRLMRDFARIAARREPDVMLCTFQSIWDLATLPVLRRTARRTILILHDAAFRSGDSYPLRGFALRCQVRQADALIVLTDEVGRDACRRYAFPSDRISTVPHGAFVFGDRPALARRVDWGRPARLLFLGRIVAYKGLGLLIEAVSRLRQDGPAVVLDIAGAGDLAPYREALAGLQDATITNHWLDDREIAAALDRADIVVLPYLEASQSGIAAAAFAAALPVVATPVGGLAEQVRHGETGLIAESVTPAALAEAIRHLLTSGDLYHRCSAGALRHAQEDLAWSAVALRVAAIARDVSRRPKRLRP